MQQKKLNAVISFISALILISLACGTTQPTPTSTTEPIATNTAVPTDTPTRRPSPTPQPTQTPDLAATQRTEELNAEVQTYFDLGYLTTTDGSTIELDDFSYDWAQLGWYNWLPLGVTTSDFFLSAHFKWDFLLIKTQISPAAVLFFPCRRITITMPYSLIDQKFSSLSQIVRVAFPVP